MNEKEKNMKKVMMIMVVIMAANTAHAAYTYTYGPGTNFGAKSPLNSESILVNGGGGGRLTLLNTNYARIESTTPLGAYYGAGQWEGGIWQIGAASSSDLDIFGGEIGRLDTVNSAHVSLYGGRILTISSDQRVLADGIKYIDIFCKNYSYNSTSNMLTGTWGNDSTFSIYLIDTNAYTPAIDNINFITVPEPLSLMLLGLGGLAARRYARR
jgi:hypothetical protein